MSDHVKNLLALYSNIEEQVVAAVKEKRLWIGRTFYIAVDFTSVFDEAGLIHYPAIEALAGSFLPSEKAKYVAPILNNFRFVSLYDYNPIKDGYQMVIAIDLTMLDRYDYQKLAANLFPTFSSAERALITTQDPLVNALADQLLGQPGVWVLALEKTALVNDMLYLPYFSKIYYRQEVADEIIDLVREFEERFGIESEVYDALN